MGLGIKYKNQEHIFREVEGETPFLEYPLFADTQIVRHGFSTRLGGVSGGCYSTLNLGFGRGDNKEDVEENFRRIAAAIGVRCEDMVFSQQTHTANVRVVTEEDRGMGCVRPLEYQDVDGLVTQVPGICLVTFYADCVPLFFVDPVKKAIGLCHSGWRGTVAKIGKAAIQLMQRQFGSDPADILAAVGPSICQECYEVGLDVIEKFQENFEACHWKDLYYQKGNGKYQLNLWKANEIVLMDAGIRKEHLAVTNVCTHCSSDVLYSHRAAGNERGSLAAFLALK